MRYVNFWRKRFTFFKCLINSSLFIYIFSLSDKQLQEKLPNDDLPWDIHAAEARP